MQCPACDYTVQYNIKIDYEIIGTIEEVVDVETVFESDSNMVD
jgi:hypothetical protein